MFEFEGNIIESMEYKLTFSFLNIIHQNNHNTNPYIHMDSTRLYNEFEPTWDSVAEEDSDTIVLYLPGFKKEQLRVQLTRTRKLIVSGEREIEGNTWTRFRKQFAVPDNCDVNGISARFDAGILYVRQPKQIIPAKTVDQELRKQKNPTENSVQLPQNPTQNSPNPLSEPSKTDGKAQNDTDKKNSKEIKQLPDLKEEKRPKEDDIKDDSKSSGLEKRTNYKLKYESIIDRVGFEVKTWKKMVMIIVPILVLLLGICINKHKAMKQPLSLR